MRLVNTNARPRLTHVEMSWLKAFAAWNILFISITCDTSHLEISWLKISALLNITSIVVTRDTSYKESKKWLRQKWRKNIRTKSKKSATSQNYATQNWAFSTRNTIFQTYPSGDVLVENGRTIEQEIHSSHLWHVLQMKKWRRKNENQKVKKTRFTASQTTSWLTHVEMSPLNAPA